MKAKYSFYRPHDRVREDGSIFDRKTGEFFIPPSKTKQAMLAECDINRIIKQFSVTGQFTHLNARARLGAFTDLPDDLDYQAALNTVIEGEQAFASLPAKVRDRFDNDPASFLQFFSDPENQDEAIKLGLVVPLPQTQVPPLISDKAPEPEPKDSPPKA